MNCYAIYSREMLLLWKKIGRMGYIFPSLISPFIYLFAFGLGLGGKVNVEGGYLSFLASGIVGMSVMTNAFQQTASSVSAGRLYFKHFHSLLLSPVERTKLVLGIVLAGLSRAAVFSILILAVSYLAFGVDVYGPLCFLGVFFGGVCFSALGTIVGLLVKQVDDISLFNSFLIMPMTFFGGSFFPTQNLPMPLDTVAAWFPIAAINTLLRASTWTTVTLEAVLILAILSSVFFTASVYFCTRYSEY